MLYYINPTPQFSQYFLFLAMFVPFVDLPNREAQFDAGRLTEFLATHLENVATFCKRVGDDPDDVVSGILAACNLS
jgi:hypothetical protein